MSEMDKEFQDKIKNATVVIKFLMWCEKENPTAVYGNTSVTDAITAFGNLNTLKREVMSDIAGTLE